MRALVALALCAGLRLARRTAPSSEYAQHGADWTMGRCSSRTAQSPINFERLGAPPTGSFSFAYQPIAELTLQQDAGGWFAELPPFGEVSFRGERYALKSLRIHAGSEHTFAGERRAAELVLEHRLIDESGMREERVLYVSFTLTSPFEVGAEPLPEEILDTAPDYLPGLALLIDTIPLPTTTPFPADRIVANPDVALLQRNSTNGTNATNATSEAPDLVLDFAPLVLSGAPDLAFFAYEGGGTRPPCGSAAWLVKRAPVRISSAQLDHLLRAAEGAVHDNWRTVMPVGFDRGVEVMEPTDGLPPAPEFAGAYRLPAGRNSRTDGELRAVWQANKAKKVANDLGDTVADLDMRVQRAAAAHRQAFAPTTLAPVDPGFGRLNAADALKVAEMISHSGNELAWDLAKQIASMHGAVDDAASISANVTAQSIGHAVKAWYLATPPPPPPPKPTPCPASCTNNTDCSSGTCEGGLCCITCTPPPPKPNMTAAMPRAAAGARAQAVPTNATTATTTTTQGAGGPATTVMPTTTTVSPTAAPATTPGAGTTAPGTTAGPGTAGPGGTTGPTTPGPGTAGPAPSTLSPTTPGAFATTPSPATPALFASFPTQAPPPPWFVGARP